MGSATHSLQAPLPSNYTPIDCALAAVRDLSASEKLFRVQMPGGRALRHRPGQFVQVSIPGFTEAPISIASSPTRTDGFDLGVRRMGTLTTALHHLQPGDTVGIRGPYGSFFPVDQLLGKDLLLIAGGCGLAPMRSLIQYCEDRRNDFGRVTILYGAKSPQDVLFRDEVEAWKCSHSFRCMSTVDSVPHGSCFDGHVGLITTLIPPLEIDAPNTVAVIVGPPVMYRYVIAELARKGVGTGQIVVSLERYMRCGIGKCGHCTIEHLYCCVDGPVFWLDQVRELRAAL